MASDKIIGTQFVSAVAKAIRSQIPERELKLYKDKPRQRFDYCSLFIDVLNLEQTKQMRNLYNRTIFLDCRIHPQRDQEDAATWCRDMAERVMAATARVNFKGYLVPCTTVETYYIEKNNEQVQHVILVYPYRAMLLPDNPDDPLFMEYLDIEQHIEYGKD